MSCLSYAFRILYLPIGIFGVAVGTVATSGLARHAAAGDMAGLRRTLRQSFSMLAFLTIPATAGLLVLVDARSCASCTSAARSPRRGTRRRAPPRPSSSTASASWPTRASRCWPPPSTPSARPASRSWRAPRPSPPTWLVNVAFYRSFGFRSVALGTSLGAWVNAAVLSIGLRRRLGPAEKPQPSAFARMIVASLAMALAAWGASSLVESNLGHHGLANQLAAGLLPVAAGIAAYALGARRPAHPRGDGPARRPGAGSSSDGTMTTRRAPAGGRAEGDRGRVPRPPARRARPGRELPPRLRPRPVAARGASPRDRKKALLALRQEDLSEFIQSLRVLGSRPALRGADGPRRAGALPLRRARGPPRRRPDGEPEGPAFLRGAAALPDDGAGGRAAGGARREDARSASATARSSRSSTPRACGSRS